MKRTLETPLNLLVACCVLVAIGIAPKDLQANPGEERPSLQALESPASLSLEWLSGKPACPGASHSLGATQIVYAYDGPPDGCDSGLNQRCAHYFDRWDHTGSYYHFATAGITCSAGLGCGYYSNPVPPQGNCLPLYCMP
jgi:hypothetical protein